MTLLVRNGERILRANLDFHLTQGVDFFIITDNLSRDGTASIIEEYVQRGRAEAIFEPADNYDQARWVTRMARRAAELGADWIINNDDDEFWFSSAGSVRDVLAARLTSCQALAVERRNHPPVENSGSRWFADAMCYRERQSYNALGQPLPAKICHRGFEDVVVFQGNHGVARAGVPLRAERCSLLKIAHYPVRDYVSFENKIVLGGAAYLRNADLDPSVGATWRYLHDLWRAGKLPAWFERQLLTPERIAEGVADGSLVEDFTVPNTLRTSA